MIITIALLAALVAVVGFGVALTVRSRREFSDANEIVPGVPSSAPASWAGSHSPEARLHRRLRDAVRSARANPKLAELGLADATRQIEADALAIDDRLVAAAGLPDRHRADAVAAFEKPVAALEDAAAALVQSVTVADSKELLEQHVSDADIKLHALAEARAEVERLDRAITDPDLGSDTVVADTDRDGEVPEADPGTATG